VQSAERSKMNKELKYCLGWQVFVMLAVIFAGQLLHHIPARAFILVVLIGVSTFLSGAFFALEVHESSHDHTVKK
jgi:hypothetical protein